MMQSPHPSTQQPVYKELFTAVYIEGGIGEKEMRDLIRYLIEEGFVPGDTSSAPRREGLKVEKDVVFLTGTHWSIKLGQVLKNFFPGRDVALLKQEYFKRNYFCFLKREKETWTRDSVKEVISLLFHHSVHAEYDEKEDRIRVFVQKKTLRAILKEENLSIGTLKIQSA